ncbi:MAG TPA: hypothetical protein DD473_20645, partial [Planctomycetaceae bacterium]|nr:hypothetical protein [Planctomycetaceae bacterium]
MNITLEPRLFVSYKSEDSQFVRAVVEQLMLSGVQVWFAEYNLLSGDHIQMENIYEQILEQSDSNAAEKKYAELIGETLRTAIGSCTHGLAFTNTPWAESVYCNQEIKWLEEQFVHDKSRVLQVCLPRETLPNHVQKLVEARPTLIQSANEPDLDEVVRFVLSEISQPSEAFRTVQFEAAQHYEIVEQGAWVDFWLGRQFDVEPRSTSEHFDQIHPERGRIFSGRFAGVPLTMSVQVSPGNAMLSSWQLSEGMQKPDRLNVSGAGMQQSLDDRRVNALLRREAGNWFTGTDFQERGCHLFWHGRSGHLAMTFLDPTDGPLGAWHRRYLLILEDPNSGRIGQLNIDFQIKCDASGQTTTFQQFLTIAPALDQLMNSFNYRGVKKH